MYPRLPSLLSLIPTVADPVPEVFYMDPGPAKTFIKLIFSESDSARIWICIQIKVGSAEKRPITLITIIFKSL